MSLGPRLAGAGLGLVVHPATGAFRGLRTRLGKAGLLEQSVMCSPRQAASHQAARTVSKSERSEIITAWARLCSPTATEGRRNEHESRRHANERRLLAHETPHLPAMGKAQLGRRMSKGKRNSLLKKRREGSASSLASASSGPAGSSNGDSLNAFTALGSVSAGDKAGRWAAAHARQSSGAYEKDPRWRATHDELTLPDYKREALGATRSNGTSDAGGPSRPPARAGTGASVATFASTSTAEVARAGIERWDSESVGTAASSAGFGTEQTRTTTGSTADSSATPESERRKPFWKGRKGKNKSRN